MGPSSSERDLEWPDCWNVRDLGGLAAGAGAIRRRALIRGDDPAFLRPQSWERLREHGVRTVVDLRYRGEGHDYRRPPTTAAAHALAGHPLPAQLQRRSVELLAPPDHVSSSGIYGGEDPTLGYRLMVDRRSAQIAQALRAVAGAQPGGVLVHCSAGRDRTGVVAALLLSLCGVEREAIAADYALSRTRIERGLDTMPQSDAVEAARRRNDRGCEAATMHALLDHIERRHGGVEAYVAAAGLSSPDLQTLRRRLLDGP